MSDAINRAKAEADRNGDPQAFEAMLIELAETVQRMSMWEVEYIAVKDRRRVTVTNTVDAAAVAAEVAKLIPRAKVRKLKVKRAEPVREVTHVPGWGTIDVYQAAGEMQKLVRDIGIVRGQRDAAEQKVVDEIRTRIALAAEYDRVEKELAKMTEYRDNALWHTDRAREERDAVIAERDQLRRDIAERIGITNTLTLKVQQLTNDLLSSPSHAELGRLRSELEHRYTELERLRVAVRDALKGDQQ